MKGAARLDAEFKTFARWITGAVLIAAIGLSWPSGANAYLITQKADLSEGTPGGLPVFDVTGLVAGDSFNLDWANLISGVDVNGMVSIPLLNSTSATIDVWINNLSDPDTRVTVFGLSIDGYLSLDIFSAGADLDQFDDSGGFSGFGDVVACATAASCTTGAGGGIVAGDSDHFTLAVFGDFVGSRLNLDSFAIKIQGVPGFDDNDSFQLPGLPSPVPVPAALPLFLSALAGLGLIGWRRNRAAA